ncbi:protein vav isoform X6 [Anopheles gambiae]|uniref:protein vav isoform X6 n=1 Tax=Anopheles gambiae TaxID=7165 RepID=UPI002AC97F9B|nr:protein vav isoform X6 [Anopheles gambiae]
MATVTATSNTMVAELWRECAAWLTRCNIIPNDHRANHLDSDIKVLATILRDGVLLCNLANFFDPSSFDRKDFNRKPQMAHFLCIQNIKLFLEACKTNFGLKEADLFEPTMLYDLTNFHRVLLTLSKLSTCRKVQTATNIPGFITHSVQTERTSLDDDIYKDLHASTSNPVEYCSHDEHDMKVEEVYQDLCSIQNASRNQLASSSNNLEQRDFVIKELLDTEKNYLEALNALKYIFMQPLEKLLSKEEIRAIFPCIRELVEIHNKFLDRLHEAVCPGSKLKLSTTFLEFREPFLIYGEYCSSMTSAVETLREACKKSNTVEQTVLQSQKEHSDGRLQLRDILSVPMQRILKYHLLLDKLVQETVPTHDDFRGLERAKEAMVDVAQYSNEVKRDSEHLIVIQKVKESISDLNLPNGNNLEQYGRLLLDGDLNIKAHEDQKMKHRYAFVFEKVMILVKNSNTKIGEAQYSFREAHNLLDYRIEILNSRRTLGRDGRLKYSLLLARKTQATAFTLYMKTEEEREKWKRAFETAITDKKIIKHMKIYQKKEHQNVFYYLSTRRYFKTIIELVSFYERNDLGENFAGLNQLLQWPFKEEIVVAIYDFAPNELNQLPMRQGCQVIVIGKEGDSKGWWRGKTLEKVGFFPKEYVRPAVIGEV